MYLNSCISPVAMEFVKDYVISGMICNNDLCFCVLHLKLWMLALIQGLALQSQGSFSFIKEGSYSWEPTINMQVNDFDLKASCDLGSSVSIMPRKIYEMLDLPPLEDCYLDVALNGNAKKKLMGSVNDVLIMVNNAYVPVDFYVLDVEYNASCPITLGRPFLRIVGAIIDMK